MHKSGITLSGVQKRGSGESSLFTRMLSSDRAWLLHSNARFPRFFASSASIRKPPLLLAPSLPPSLSVSLFLPISRWTLVVRRIIGAVAETDYLNAKETGQRRVLLAPPRANEESLVASHSTGRDARSTWTLALPRLSLFVFGQRSRLAAAGDENPEGEHARAPLSVLILSVEKLGQYPAPIRLYQGCSSIHKGLGVGGEEGARGRRVDAWCAIRVWRSIDTHGQRLTICLSSAT